MDVVCNHPAAPAAPADKLNAEILECARRQGDRFHVTDAVLPSGLWCA